MKNDVSRRYRTRVNHKHHIQRHYYLPGRGVLCYKPVYGGTVYGKQGKNGPDGPGDRKAAYSGGAFVSDPGDPAVFHYIYDPSGTLYRYISKISDAVQNISEGNLNTVIDVIGDDEFSGMAANLNRMAADIKQLMEKERESERTKNELITNVAHDLRTPLTSIIGYLELLAGNRQIPEDMQHKYIEIAYGKSRRLEKLIEDLFGFTKLNYGKIAMHVGQLDIVKLLGQLLEEAYPNFVEKGLSYDLQSNVPAKTINADGNLLARLFDNLIGNAIKYGADGKRVLVQIHAESETVTVSVTNYGYVIPADELPLIFNKFYRVEQSRSSSTGGTGLDLPLQRRSWICMEGPLV